MTNDAERVSDIVARLRRVPNRLAGGPVAIGALMTDTADIIEAQSKALAEAQAEIERMMPQFVAYEYLESPARADIAEEALKPFAEFVPDFFDDGYQDDDIVSITSHHGGLDLTLTVGDFRRARAALIPTPENPNG